MLYDRILIRYGELSLKGKNKKRFIDKILNTIKFKCQSFKNLEYQRNFDRLYIILNGENHEDVIDTLNTIFGIHSFSLCAKCETNLDAIKELATEVVKTEIKEQIENLFKIKVEKVRTLLKGNKKYIYVKLKKEFPAIDVATKLGII